MLIYFIIKMSVNIDELINNNPVTKLSDTYQNKFLSKIKERFIDSEQQLFINSFYCYLNYNSKTDFVVDLDNIWKWLGFSNKAHSKLALEKNFIINTDYKSLLTKISEQKNSNFSPPTYGSKKNNRGGHNKEKIMLNIETFKKFCLKAGTKKADEIHDYFIKLEETFYEVLQEECSEIKLQLFNKEIIYVKDNQKIREKTLLEQFPNNTQCVYYGTIDNLSNNNEKLIKFGNSNNLGNRVKQHRDTYSNFVLINAFRVVNKLQIENALKVNEIFCQRQRTITLGTCKFIELISAEDITFAELDKIIKEIINEIEYSQEKYIKLLDENKQLKKQIEEYKETDHTNELILLKSENTKLKVTNLKLTKKLNKKFEIDHDVINDSNEDLTLIKEDIENYNVTINQISLNTFFKDKDGNFIIANKKYTKITGTRDEVWNGIAYKTTGGLIKSQFILNYMGKVVSRKKSIQEANGNRFIKYGVNVDPKNNNVSV